MNYPLNEWTSITTKSHVKGRVLCNVIRGLAGLMNGGGGYIQGEGAYKWNKKYVSERRD